jgi:23S rRNA pseudouridine1911/1915/1917 synthase
LKRVTLKVQKADAGERLDRFLAGRGGMSRGEARRILDRGGVWVDGHRVKVASRGVHPGQCVEAVLEEAGRGGGESSTRVAPHVIFEDDAVVAVDKPALLDAQPTRATDRESVLTWVSAHLGSTAGLVHRLDRETSGVMVFGKTRDATRVLAAAFRDGTARKRYLTVAFGEVEDEGRITLPLRRDPSRPGRFLAREDGGLPAATRYRLLARKGKLCGLEVFPETGRTHQIRAHLCAIGAPIVGDIRYGGPRDLGELGARAERVMLHARSLVVPHPDGRVRTFESRVPPDLLQLMALAGVDPALL